MESSSSGRFQVVFAMFLMLLSVSLAVEQKESNDICKEKDKPGFQLNLTGAMIFSDHIFMMDNKSQVYKVPKSNYDGAYGKMVMNIKGIPIEKYWPALASNSDWQCIKPLYKSIYHLINEHTGDVFINIFVNENKECTHGSDAYSVCYNLKTEKFCPLPTIKVDYHKQFYVDTGLKIYNIEPFLEGTATKFFPTLATWKFIYSADNHTILNGSDTLPLIMYYLVSNDNSNNRNVSFYFAENFKTKPENPPPGYHLENITDWNISDDYLPVGYLYNGSFYLYALDKLIVFEDNVPSYDAQIPDHKLPEGKLMASSKVTVIKLSDYFQCDSDNQSTVTVPPDVHGNKTASSTTASGTMLIIIIASLVLLLILIGAAILIYCLAGGKKGSEKKSKGKDSKHKKLSEKSEKPSVVSSSVVSKVSSKVGGKGGSKMGGKQSSIAGGQSKAASSTAASAASSSKVMPPLSKIGKKIK